MCKAKHISTHSKLFRSRWTKWVCSQQLEQEIPHCWWAPLRTRKQHVKKDGCTPLGDAVCACVCVCVCAYVDSYVYLTKSWYLVVFCRILATSKLSKIQRIVSAKWCRRLSMSSGCPFTKSPLTTNKPQPWLESLTPKMPVMMPVEIQESQSTCLKNCQCILLLFI